jgi:hypothetical protein
MDDDELQKRYAQYKDSLTSRQLTQFFNTNKDKEWFKEKYHPTVSLSRCQDTKERRQKYLAKFLIELASGQYDNVGYDKEGQSTGDDTEEPEEALVETSNNDNEEEYEPYLVIKTVPPTISRDRIKEVSHSMNTDSINN